MKFLRFYLLVALTGICCLAQAHVGSPAINYQGKVGKYDVVISVMPPDVIPGEATTSIYIENYHGEKVYVQTQYFKKGKSASADPELATPVPGSPGSLTCGAWLMVNGAANINFRIEGSQGEGMINIPVMSFATGDRRVPAYLAVILAVMSILLFSLMIAIIRASVSDGQTKPGEPTPNRRAKKNRAVAITTLVLLILFGFAVYWCRDERGRYLAYLYRPIKGLSQVFKYNGQNVLSLAVDTTNFDMTQTHQPMSYVIPDHGKLMHLALIKEKTFDVFAHLHPIRQDSIHFLVNLPPLPPGRYFMYGDIVSYNGAEETIVDTVKIMANPQNGDAKLNGKPIKTSPDDAWTKSGPLNSAITKPVTICDSLKGMSYALGDGYTMVLESRPNEKIKPALYHDFKFHVFDAKGNAPPLQMYMGMEGHAIIAMDDGSIYAHLHPVGNFAMAAQMVVDRRMMGRHTSGEPPEPNRFRDSIDRLVAHVDSMTEDQRNAWLMSQMDMGNMSSKKDSGMGDMKGMDHSKMKMGDMKGMDHSKMNMDGMGDMKGMDMGGDAKAATCGSVVKYPYTFPKAGKYRIWMEVKINGKIYTGVFDLECKN